MAAETEVVGEVHPQQRTISDEGDDGGSGGGGDCGGDGDCGDTADYE